MLNRLFLLISLIVILSGAANADIRLFLFPNITSEKDSLILGDIASVEANNSDSEQIKNIIIEPQIISDGYIDRKEILSILKKYTNKNIVIYGNAVRIADDQYHNNSFPDQNDFLLKKGDRVEVIINNKGVSLILKGIAVNEGRINEEINVRIRNKSAMTKLMKAKVIGRDLVEVNI